MSDSTSDLPATLAAAEQKFKEFLRSQGYPEKVRWLMRDDVMVDEQLRFWVRERGTKRAVGATLRYSEGVERNLGIALRAICATDRETFASVFVPADDLDAQYALMGDGLKLSCPISRRPVSTVKNPLRWLILRLRNRRRSRMLEL